MKKSHGKIILLYLLLSIQWGLTAGFVTKFSISNQNPYVKEPIVITLEINQTDYSKVMLFKFSPKKSDVYEFHRIDAQQMGDSNAQRIRYIYLLYPLKSGKLKIDVDLLQMITTDEKMAFSFEGDRENVNRLNKQDIPIDLPALTLDVKDIPQNTQLVGDFVLDISVSKNEAKSFEPVPLSLTLKGLGYPPLLDNVIPKSRNYKLFAGKVEQESIHSQKGTHNSTLYPFALSAQKSFVLAPISIQAFNPATKQSYTLTTQKKEFHILTPKSDSLIDTIDSPPSIHQGKWDWIEDSIGYLIVFVAGFLSASFLKYLPRPQVNKDSKNLSQEINSCKSHKELLQLLLSQKNPQHQESLELLESVIYRGKKIPLETIKRKVNQNSQ